LERKKWALFGQARNEYPRFLLVGKEFECESNFHVFFSVSSWVDDAFIAFWSLTVFGQGERKKNIAFGFLLLLQEKLKGMIAQVCGKNMLLLLRPKQFSQSLRRFWPKWIFNDS
jgi:hypothetical protein